MWKSNGSKMARVNISDVAREAGVSLGTVSNAINHPERVRPETRRLIEEAIERLGYLPNQSARLRARLAAPQPWLQRPDSKRCPQRSRARGPRSCHHEFKRKRRGGKTLSAVLYWYAACWRAGAAVGVSGVSTSACAFGAGGVPRCPGCAARGALGFGRLSRSGPLDCRACRRVRGAQGCGDRICFAPAACRAP